jgi:uncharacterized protein (TIGR03382 family)
MMVAHAVHVAAQIPGGQVLVAGGISVSTATLATELYDPSQGTWSDAGDLLLGVYGHTGTALVSGQVLVTGGTANGNTGFAATELYTAAPSDRGSVDAGAGGSLQKRYSVGCNCSSTDSAGIAGFILALLLALGRRDTWLS